MPGLDRRALGALLPLLVAACARAAPPCPPAPAPESARVVASAQPAPAAIAEPPASEPAVAAPPLAALSLDAAPRVALTFDKLGPTREKGDPFVQAVGRADGALWLVPRDLAAKEPLRIIRPGKPPATGWHAAVGATVWAWPTSDDGVWLLASRAEPAGVFGFPRVVRLVRLDAKGRAAHDVAWQAGRLRVAAGAPDGAGGLWLTGTLAGPLTSSAGTVAPADDGRAEALVHVDANGSVATATLLPGLWPGSARAIAASPEGWVAVAGYALDGLTPALSRVGGDGTPLPTRAFDRRHTGNAFFRSRLEAMIPDGAGGLFVVGQVGIGNVLDLGGPAPLPEGGFIARLDASGKQRWARALDADSVQLLADGHGGARVVRLAGPLASALDVDSDGAVRRVFELALPKECQLANAWLSVSQAKSELVGALACQAYDDSYLPRKEVGAPVVYTARAPAP